MYYLLKILYKIFTMHVCSFQWLAKNLPFGDFWFYGLDGGLDQILIFDTAKDI